jgi:hypothetical protein
MSAQRSGINDVAVGHVVADETIKQKEIKNMNENTKEKKPSQDPKTRRRLSR